MRDREISPDELREYQIEEMQERTEFRNHDDDAEHFIADRAERVRDLKLCQR